MARTQINNNTTTHKTPSNSSVVIPETPKQKTAEELLRDYYLNASLGSVNSVGSDYNQNIDRYKQDYETLAGQYANANLSANESNAYLTALQNISNYITNAQSAQNAQQSAVASANSQAINAGVSRDLSSRYMGNVLNSSGLGNQGVSESSRISMDNNYRNALNDISLNKSSTLNTIDQAYQSANQQSAQGMSEALSTLTQERLNNTLTGYQTQLNNADPLNYDDILDQARNELDTTSYNALAQQVSEAKAATAQTVLSRYGVDSTNESSIAADVAGTRAYNDFMTAEFLQTLRGQVNNGVVKDGTVIQLRNSSSNNASYGYFVYYNGRLYKVADKNANNNQAIQYQI